MRSLDQLQAECVERGRGIPWCVTCRTWHFDDCTDETRVEGFDRELACWWAFGRYPV